MAVREVWSEAGARRMWQENTVANSVQYAAAAKNVQAANAPKCEMVTAWHPPLRVRGLLSQVTANVRAERRAAAGRAGRAAHDEPQRCAASVACRFASARAKG
jgi:hypothetical protein